MKTRLVTLIIFVTVVVAPTFAQSGKTQTPKQNHIWLLNSEGQTIKTSNDTISRSFLMAQTVSAMVIPASHQDVSYMAIIQPPKGTAKAYSFQGAIFPVGLKNELEKVPSGTRLTVSTTHKNADGPPGAITVILKE